MKKGLIITIIVAVLIVAVFIPFKMTGSTTKNKINDPFVTCLAEKGAKMYGAYWCSHCNNQKEAFGSSFDLFNSLGGYVECDPKGKNAQPAKCEEAGILGYPTWIINGQVYEGEQSLSRLSAISECDLNEN